MGLAQARPPSTWLAVHDLAVVHFTTDILSRANKIQKGMKARPKIKERDDGVLVSLYWLLQTGRLFVITLDNSV